MKKTIVLTGGGSAGHVTVNAALIPKLLDGNWDIHYFGSIDGIEKQIISKFEPVQYHGISTGKLRRYADWNNVKDPFKVVKGSFEAYAKMKQLKPNVIFSKGGFVSVPVVVAGRMRKVPVIIHESDITPGLANRIAIPFSTKVCTTFPETCEHVTTKKAEYVGAIVRDELLAGNAGTGRAICRFAKGKPVLFIMGGSLGAKSVNQAVRDNLPALLKKFHVVHISGKGQLDDSINDAGYKQFEFVNEELPHLMAMADVVISRAGSNSIFEFLSLRKPMLLVPLPKGSSRGDQILNARSFADRGFCEVLNDAEVRTEAFVHKINDLHEKRNDYVNNMLSSDAIGSTDRLVQMIERYKR
ncbi:undecaprenyldiphospho-muramoylpentapeptide beta-N-acetylglucosaminyltransferase [Paenibacillus sp. MER TA 81-3]|uniref:undecaprenyldiphospho-muramoylpentapeptide beta-N-acetylglucosaminyltransferase n=1 Tax=Paenibacillus sp. MER TA 81-3 TaxID=2939573 RepID=UPI00203D0E89|nr:undecaprenyldiphospho-muramoylpentapeptide beta-N-acetylglucosaminyltransferase [Paenibacillus sp. MER TA 81-3]MCM3342479.1 undecaprenyldiphospho-muramoylpentapeptide beta-N-acetylglucosaminyltransferase [Paenibacillus sp. MER TA 81-3]